MSSSSSNERNEEDDDSTYESSWSTASTPGAITSSKKKTRLTYSLDSVSKPSKSLDIEENEEVENLNSAANPSNTAENNESTKQVRSYDQSNASPLKADIPALKFNARELRLKLTITPEFLESVELIKARAKMSQCRALAREDPCITSSTGSNPQSPESESSQEAAATVEYNHIFKMILTDLDVNSNTMQIPVAEAEEHFPPLAATYGESVDLQVHDVNRKQIMQWKLTRYKDLYCICREWKEYVTDNQLQAGDYVVFYKTSKNQSINNEPPPRYAVQFEKKRDNC